MASELPLKTEKGYTAKVPLHDRRSLLLVWLAPGPGGGMKYRDRQDTEDMVPTCKDLKGPLDRQGAST